MEYTRMDRKQKGECALLAAKAFETYEYFSCYIPDESARSRFITKMLQIEMSVNYSSAQTLIAKENGKIIAVAMLFPPEHKKPSDFRYMLAGFMQLYKIVDKQTLSAWLKMEGKAGEPCHSVGGEHTWYLNSLTVDPSVQGRGIASAMLRECIIPHVRANGGTALTLYTNSEKNCAFYEKNGFTQFHRTTFEYKGSVLGSWSFKLEV